ncbi:MAG: glycosyltransferase [Desulfuromonadales bacterium]|nr:glycosyltransferase [Desulfuromonadales bacterium]
MADQRLSSPPKVLIVVYDFPPEIGGGGVMRTVKFVKYLRESGWQPVVLTVARRDTLMPDPGLLLELGDTPVYRCPDWISRFNTGGSDGQTGGNLAGNWRNRFLAGFKELIKGALIPDRRAGWLLPALLLGRRVVKREGIAVIYATAPPQTPLLVGYLLSLFTTRPLVVDYRDAWGGNNLFRSRLGLKNALNGWLERRVLGKAALAVATTPALLALLRQFTSRTSLIYNGFDPEDFIGLSPRRLDNGKVNLVYLGGFDGYRTAGPLARALAFLDTDERARLALHVIGPVSSRERALFDGLPGVEINLVGTLPHRQALEYLLSAQALLVVIFPEEDSDRAIPGKIYEYLATGKPILALCEKQSALGLLLNDLGVGTIVPPKDVTQIAAALKALATDSRPGAEQPQAPAIADLSLFDRQQNARRLADHFEGACSSHEP